MMKLTQLSTLLNGTIEAALILLILCTVSNAEISRATAIQAWRRIASADGFRALPINFEDDSEPNAWVKFVDEDDFSLHVTAGLMRLLCTESEIAGVLGHELGHIRLGHYGGMILTDTARTVIGINSGTAEDISRAVGEMNMDLHESAFSRQQETEADNYGTELLRKSGYDPWGLYNAMKRFETTEHSGFNSHPATRERLANLAEMAGKIQPKKGNLQRNSLNDIADILMGQ